MVYRKYIVTIVLVLTAVMVVPVFAQDNVVVDGLLNPRNMSFDSEGNLYVAEAGVAVIR